MPISIESAALRNGPIVQMRHPFTQERLLFCEHYHECICQGEHGFSYVFAAKTLAGIGAGGRERIRSQVYEDGNSNDLLNCAEAGSVASLKKKTPFCASTTSLHLQKVGNTTPQDHELVAAAPFLPTDVGRIWLNGQMMTTHTGKKNTFFPFANRVYTLPIWPRSHNLLSSGHQSSEPNSSFGTQTRRRPGD